MKPSLIIQNVDVVLESGLAAYIKGAPGIGKSTVVRDYAIDRKLDFIDLRAAQLDPVDARGVPIADIAANLTRWLPPDFLPKTGRGILFLDELNRASRDTQSALYQLILDGKIGTYTLPIGWSIISAGNRETDGAQVQPMSRALKNRFIHFEMTVDAEDFHNYAMKNHFDERIIAYIHYKPDSLDEMETAIKNEKGDIISALRQADAFATPRSWEFASRLLQTAATKNMTLMDCYSLLEGAVGPAAAGEFTAYCNIYRELPDIDNLLKNPSSFKALTDASQVYALCIGITARANERNFANVVEVLGKLPKEYMMWTMDDCLNRHPDLGKHKAYLDWVHKYIEYAS